MAEELTTLTITIIKSKVFKVLKEVSDLLVVCQEFRVEEELLGSINSQILEEIT